MMNSEVIGVTVLCVKIVETTAPPPYYSNESSKGGHCVNGEGLAVTYIKSRASVIGGNGMIYSMCCDERIAGLIVRVVVAHVSIS